MIEVLHKLQSPTKMLVVTLAYPLGLGLISPLDPKEERRKHLPTIPIIFWMTVAFISFPV